MHGLPRLVLPLAVAASALIAASAAPAATGTWGHRALPAPTGKTSPTVKRALRAAPTAPRAGAMLSSAATAQLAAGEFPGFAYCGNDIAYVWPADAPTHDMTLTRTYAVHSASGTFSDAVVDPSPFYIAQVGQDYTFWDIQAAAVAYGPTIYADAWLDFDLTGNNDYVIFINEVTFLDGANMTTEYHLVDALGPSKVGTTNACRP